MFGESQLFWYKIVFMAELILSEAMFVCRLKRRRFFVVRLLLSLAALFAIAVFFPLFSWSYNAFYSSFLFFSLFAATLGAIAVCFREPFVNIMFCGVAAYSVQHIAFQFYGFIVNVASLNHDAPIGIYGDVAESSYNIFTGMVYGISYSMVYWLMFVLFASRIEKNSDMRIRSVALLMLAAFTVVVCVVLNAVFTYGSYEEYNGTFTACMQLSMIISCTLALCVQFGMLSNREMKTELDNVYHLWHQEQKQFASTKANIDLINTKCHDMKHLVRRIGSTSAVSENAIREIEDAINIYDSAVKTGNSALDVILTEKSLMCSSHNITFTVVADGGRLGFMNEVDLYTLFGNAIDNAVEAVMQLPEEKRIISLTTNGSGDLFSVNIRNFYSGAVTLSEGLPVTTKGDTDYHGFGMKSIKRIVEKYGGDLSVVADGGVFNLNMLFSDEGGQL